MISMSSLIKNISKFLTNLLLNHGDIKKINIDDANTVSDKNRKMTL